MSERDSTTRGAGYIAALPEWRNGRRRGLRITRDFSSLLDYLARAQ